MDAFPPKDGGLENDWLSYRQPVKIAQNWCDVVTASNSAPDSRRAAVFSIDCSHFNWAAARVIRGQCLWIGPAGGGDPAGEAASSSDSDWQVDQPTVR